MAKNNKELYDPCTILIEKGKKEKIKAFAKDNNESMNSYIKRLIKEDMEKYGYGK